MLRRYRHVVCCSLNLRDLMRSSTIPVPGVLVGSGVTFSPSVNRGLLRGCRAKAIVSDDLLQVFEEPSM